MSREDQMCITPFQQIISSFSGAVITSFFVTPLDVVKIRLQAQQKPFHNGTPFLYNNGLMDHVCICSHCEANGNSSSPNQYPAASSRTQHVPWYSSCNKKFTGTLDAFLKISRAEGISSLWSGLSPTLVMAVPATIVYYTTYDQLKYALGYREKDPSTQYIPAIAGSTARTFTTILVSPLELIRTKIQSEQLKYKELGKAVRMTINESGATVLMRGLGPTLLRDVPFSAILWFGYEKLKAFQMMRDGNIDGPPTFRQTIISGGVAGSVAAVLTLPFDVIKTHRQIELGTANFNKNAQITSTWQLMKTLHSEKGIRGLYAGITPRLAKVTPACAIMISSYEYGKTFFRNHNAHKQMDR